MRPYYRDMRVFMLLGLTAVGLGACDTTKSHKAHINAPHFDTDNAIMIAEDTITQQHHITAGFIPPATGTQLAAKERKNCAFSKYHREETVGYEFDQQRRLAFRVDPDIDLFDLGDSEVEVSLRYTIFLGGRPNKKLCTFGTGYYGLVPFVGNNPQIFDNLTDINHIKSMVEDELF